MVRNFQFQYFPSWYDDFISVVGDGKKGVYRTVFGHARGKCQLCGNKLSFMHPIFDIDHKAHQRKLKRFIATCSDCGKNLKLSELQENEEGVISYWSDILKRPKSIIESQIDDAWHQYVETLSYSFSWPDTITLTYKPPLKDGKIRI